MLTKDQILAASDVKTEEVQVEEWGGSVGVKTLSAANMITFLDVCRNKKGELLVEKLQPELLVRAVVGDDGQPLFTDTTELMSKSAAAINKLFEAAQRLNGMGKEADAIEKNSDAATSGDSPSA